MSNCGGQIRLSREKALIRIDPCDGKHPDGRDSVHASGTPTEQRLNDTFTG